jgi:uncharacterized protein
MLRRLLTLSLPFTLCLLAQPAAPGTRLDTNIPIQALNDPATYIPVSIFEGTKPGPTLLLTCGVHGFEFVPILAAQRLLTEIDPKQLSGRVILVRLAHVPAFERRSIFYNPHDGKNLNRVFPGSPLGTQSERIAYALTELIEQSTLHIDLHGGDGSETLDNFAGTYGGSLAKQQFETSLSMARAFGLPRIVDYAIEDMPSSRSCNRQAVAMGKPTLLVELGQQGRFDAADVDLTVRGVLNVLKSQKMLPGTPAPPRTPPQRFSGTTGVSFTQSGIWYPSAKTGARVSKGDLLGVVKDFLGKELEKITAPEAGIILYMTVAPPANRGEAAVTIALPAK